MRSRLAAALAALAVASCLAFALAAPGPALAAPIVTFPDVALSAAVHSAMGVPLANPIYASNLATLTVLSAPSAGIAHLDGLESAVGLTSLTLNDNDITTITALASMPALKSADLANNHISDVTPLSQLATLATLNLGHNPLSSADPLQGLANLTTLDVSDAGLTSFSALQGLNKLTSLDVGGNAASDLLPLRGAGKMQYLGIDGDGVIDISPLQGMTDLRQLSASDNHIFDLAPLHVMSHLSDVELSDNDVFDLSPIAGAPIAHAHVEANWLDLTPGSDASLTISAWRAGAAAPSDVVWLPQKAGGSIVGTVMTSAGAPLPGVVMKIAGGPAAVTSGDGSYAVRVAPTGARTLTFSKPFYNTVVIPLSVSAGGASTISPAMTPVMLHPLLTHSPSKSSLTYERKRGVAKFTVSAAVADARGPVVGAFVQLQSSANGKKWKTLSTLRTNGSGRVSRSFSARKKGSTYYRWNLLATVQDFGVTTGMQKVAVK